MVSQNQFLPWLELKIQYHQWTNKHFSEIGTLYTVHTHCKYHTRKFRKSRVKITVFCRSRQHSFKCCIGSEILETKEREFDINDADYLVLEPRVVFKSYEPYYLVLSRY